MDNTKRSTTQSIARSGVWIFLRVLILSSINLGVISVLARVLEPSDFGLVALAGAIIQFFTFLSSRGVSNYIIHLSEDDSFGSKVQSAFCLDIIISFFILILLLIFVPFLSNLYHDKTLGLILLVLAFKFPLDALTRAPIALLKKKLVFKTIELCDSLLAIFAALLSLLMVFSGFGVWSLVLPTIVISPLKVFLIFKLSGWRPTFALHLKYWREIFGYTSCIMGSTLTTFILSQGDTLLVGKLFNESLLGIYNIAWRSSKLVSKSFLQLSQKLSLPVLAQYKDNDCDLHNRLVRIMRTIAIVCLPPLIAQLVLADLFVLCLYGPKWASAVLPLRILIVYSLRFVVFSPTGSTFDAIGRPDICFNIGLAVVPFYLLGIYLGSFYGVVGVALGVTVVRTFSGLINIYYLSKLLKTSFNSFLKPLFEPLLFSIYYALALLCVRKFLFFVGLSNSFMLLFLTILLSIPLGILIFRVFFPTLSEEIVRLLSSFLSPQYSRSARNILCRR